MARAPHLAEHPELELPEIRKLWQTEGLFSDHYLKGRIKSNSWWPSDHESRPIWEFCKALYEKRYVTCAKNNEAFTRQELINKILEKLGFAWTDNLGLPETQQDLEPDYILFGSESEKEAVIEKNAAQRYRAAISLLEAKKVNHPLSQISTRQQRYPHQQIRDYINEAQVINWGVLTNGNEWRLYCRDAKPSQFFALNFSEAIKSLENFKFFIALFTPTAFVRDAQGHCRLDEIRENALAAQVELEEDLRVRIFTILEILANGFFNRAENGITESDLALLYDRCLIFLYRLLFILYAEGRDLLPVHPKSRRYYKDLSIAHLTNSLKNFSDYDSHTRTRLFEDVRELCHLINGTDEKKNREYDVPRYNGGLFEPARYPELERWRVSDAVLADVLRGMMFSPPPKRDQPSLPVETVDFGDLRVQQLGSIYEGLMEHHFHRDAATLKLVADKAERRQTGTYYTPDYIVKYIVDQTLRPLLDGIEASESVKSALSLSRQNNAFADAVLALNVCDPAMGSGHFLVEATTVLADQIVYHPTTHFQATKEPGVPQEQTEIAFWRRRVVESCIYGADLNPLAVELAKLSLWLTTIAADQPLNFLDHHLRCGNSLIGALVDELGALPERKKKSKARRSGAPQQIQFAFGPDFQRVISETIHQIHSIEERASGDVAAVKDKEKRWREKILPALAPYKAVGDFWTSTFFGDALSPEIYLSEAQEILAGRKVDNEPARNYRFFHWELEFPEVFFADDGARREKGGFDAVIGNPPYGTITDKTLIDFVRYTFESFEGNLENYGLFMELALSLIRAGGRNGLIVPITWCQIPQFSRTRSLILKYQLETLVELPAKVFSGSDLDTCIYVVERSPSPEDSLTQIISAREATLDEPDRWRRGPVVSKREWVSAGTKFSFSFSRTEAALLAKMRTCSSPLEQIFDYSQGIVPYARDELYRKMSQAEADRIVDERLWHASSQRDDSFKRELKGDDVGRYRVTWNGQQWVRYGSWLARAREPRFFNGPRILIQEITRGKSLRAGFTSEEFYNNPGIVNVVPKAFDSNSLDALNYTLALINSSLFFFWHMRTSPKAKLVTSIPKILVEDVARLPIRRIELTTPRDKRAALLAETKHFFTTGRNDQALRFVQEQLAAKPERSDAVHDVLAFLAQEMTRLSFEERAAASAFTVDLKDFHGVEAHALTPKTRLDEFWTLDAAELFAHLRKNARRLEEKNVRLTGIDEEKIRERFTRAKETIIPLEAQIVATGALIDQIIYRLYGLTPDEVKIVEEGK